MPTGARDITRPVNVAEWVERVRDATQPNVCNTSAVTRLVSSALSSTIGCVAVRFPSSTNSRVRTARSLENAINSSIRRCNPFTASSALDADLQTLEHTLVAQKLTYRIFSTNVSIRGAKWSRVQTK